MISKKAKYGLQAMIHIANHHSEGNILIADIAQAEGISKKFLEMILLELKNHGLLKSKKGKGGGYALAKPLHQIFVGEILRILDGPLAPVPCVSQTAYQRCKDCLDENTCAIRFVMKDVRDAMANIVDRCTLEDLIQKSQDLRNQEGGHNFMI